MFEPGTLGEIVDGHTLRFVRTVRHSPERVWRAITDEGEVAAWMNCPVTIDGRVGGRVSFFDEAHRIEGKVFIFDPPRTFAHSFADVRLAEHMALVDQDWTVRWDLEETSDGCRITFTNRNQSGAVLWGVGEGWHAGLDLLEAYLDGRLEPAAAAYAQSIKEGDWRGFRAYRVHVSGELASWAKRVAADARGAVQAGRCDDALAAIDRLELATRQLQRIARQEGARPDYSLPDATPTRP
jgi:uncharacterized protein YndB with AHSA1/START domain